MSTTSPERTPALLHRRKEAQIEAWWSRQRRQGRPLHRLHRAEDVALLRLATRPAYRVQNAMAWKLYRSLRRHQSQGTSINTLGAFDEASLDALVRAGLEAVYVGGWAESARAGTSDQARYPYDYVCRTVARFSRFLQQKARHDPAQEERFLVPLVVDLDTGHLAPKEMLEAMLTTGTDAPLVAAVHLEDQAHGCKKCGHMSGKVLVSTAEQIRRLNELRLQLDVMGLDTLLIARTDAEAAEFITSTLDPRDHPFLLGATCPQVIPYHEFIEEVRKRGAGEEEVARLHRQWCREAGLKTLEETVLEALQEAASRGHATRKTQEQWQRVARLASLQEARQAAHRLGFRLCNRFEWELLSHREGGENLLFWDEELPRTEEMGYTLYMIRSGIEMAVARSRAFLPFADLSWMEQHRPDLEQTRSWARALQETARERGWPPPLLANNTSPSFYWRAPRQGQIPDDQALETFLSEQAKAGIQFQFITYGGAQLNHFYMQHFLQGEEGFLRRGMRAWADFQDQAMQARNPFVGNSQRWAGVGWNEARDAAGRGSLVARATGERDTMRQFSPGPQPRRTAP